MPKWVESDLGVFETDMRNIGSRVRYQVSRALDRDIPRIAANAASRAPKDRPWLGVLGQGIRYDTGGLSRRIYSPLDPEGNAVGLHVEYGTSFMAPQPFLTPALEEGSTAFFSHVSDAVERELGKRG